MQTLIRNCILLCLILDLGICQCPKCPNPGFTDNPLSTTLLQEQCGYKEPLPGFHPTRGLITLVNDSESVTWTNYDSVVNNRPKKNISDEE